MHNPFRLTVLTPAQALIDVEEAQWVQARLADGGGIGIYPGHAPLIAETVTAPLRYADPTGEHTLELESGILQVQSDGVTIFTSGLSQPPEDSQPSEDDQDSDASDMRNFDRLAQELLAATRADPSIRSDLGLEMDDEAE
jgi:F-type H+-transporting ATPase subunit epsilon